MPIAETSFTHRKQHNHIAYSAHASSMFAVATLISDRSSPIRFLIFEILRSPCDFSETKSRIRVRNSLFFLVRHCGDDTTTTSSTLELFADLLLVKIVNRELMSSLLKL
nr:hypothetical protein Itr_chr06CG06720 [Ipomoea trifida]